MRSGCEVEECWRSARAPVFLAPMVATGGSPQRIATCSPPTPTRKPHPTQTPPHSNPTPTCWGGRRPPRAAVAALPMLLCMLRAGGGPADHVEAVGHCVMCVVRHPHPPLAIHCGEEGPDRMEHECYNAARVCGGVGGGGRGGVACELPLLSTRFGFVGRGKMCSWPVVAALSCPIMHVV